jgi:chorismate--pyruvate lyase
MARSIIPNNSSSGSNHEVLRLGKKPLGAVLFAKTRMHSKKKLHRAISRLDKKSALWKKCFQKYPELPSVSWARRTLYQLKGRPILVSEVFLPALLNYPSN